nr:MAG TPA: hypothetical protein [Caudoviricetes sp.]
MHNEYRPLVAIFYSVKQFQLLCSTMLIVF